jgi:biopolymer transport protein ExbD
MEPTEGTPNLTPILDMVFQLITFFMLVINFKSASMDLSLHLPVVGSARPVEGQTDLLILNITTDGKINVYGIPQEDIENYISREAASTLLTLHREHPELQAGDELPTIVVIRADKSTPFTLLYRVITACQKQGFRHFALKAMNKGES